MPATRIENRGRRLSPEQVRTIRRLVAEGTPQATLARELGVHPSTLWDVVHFASYREVR